MGYIVHANNLYDNYLNENFGYVGIEIETGKVRYFTHYDEFGIYQSNKIFEFDINNPSSELLKGILRHCNYRRQKYSEKLPKEMEPLVDEYMDNHRTFNIEKGYPTEMLDFNRQYLSIDYVKSGRAFVGRNFLARYLPFENILDMCITEEEWQICDDYTKNIFKNALLHEIGHMKISNAQLDEKKLILKTKMGFLNVDYELEPIRLDNGDIFFKMINLEKRKIDIKENILEEVMNEYECDLIDSNYNPTYPNVGDALNNLCDGRLIGARYTNGIEEYYESLIRIINDRNMADELLYSILEIASSSEYAFKKNNKYMQKLLRKYENEKIRNR